MRQLFRLTIWVTRRRLRKSWGTSAVSALGILIAVVLLSAAALYSNVLAEAGVRFALFSERSNSLHIQTIFQNRPLSPEDYVQLRASAESVFLNRVGNLTVDVQRFGRTQAGMPLTTDAGRRPPPQGAPSGRPFFMAEFDQHSLILEGRWPEANGTSNPEGVELEAAIGGEIASDVRFGLGSRVFITPFRSAPEERIVLNIVGVVAPEDPRDEFWLGSPRQFRPQTVGDLQVIPFYVTEGDFHEVLGRRFPTAVGDFGFNIFIDPFVITATDVDHVQESLELLEIDLNKAYPRTFVFSRLGLTLDDFERELTLARVPVYVFVSLVVIVILYFLMLITGILGRSQSDELGMLRSRGASVLQVCGALIIAESAMAVVATVIGAPIAWAIVRFLLLPSFGNPGGGAIELPLSGDVFLAGAAGAAISVAVLAISALGRARTEVSDSLATRSRPPQVSAFHRYYFDVLVLVLVALVWWQFQERDGFLSRTIATRNIGVDPFVVLGPALGLLAATLLFMRFLPMTARTISWLCMRAGPGWSSYGLARLARDPILPSSLAVLLMLAAALGVFGATLQASLARSQSEQTKYRVGGEHIVTGTGVTTALAGRLSQVDGVQGATPVLRDSVNLIQGHASFPALLIAANPSELAQSAWFREDFSHIPLSQLMSMIQVAGGASAEDRVGKLLPLGTARIGVWLDTTNIQSRELAADLNVWARISNGERLYRNVSLGGFGGPNDALPSGWRLFSAELPERALQDDGDSYLSSIFFTTSSFVRVTAGQIHLDDFTAFGPTLPDDGVVVEDFDAPVGWAPLSANASVPDRAETSPAAARSGTGGTIFSWEAPFGGEQRGVHIPPVPLPLPAIGGPGLEVGQVLRIRHGNASIPIRVDETSDLFATVTDFQRPFILLDLDAYLSYLKFLPPSGLYTSPQQVWLSFDENSDPERVSESITAMLPSLTTLTSRTDAAATASSNPLAGGGWNALTGLSMACVGLAIVIAMFLYSTTSVRAGRMDTSVAHALGLSASQLFLAQALERLLTGAAALAAGAAIGYFPGRELVRLLDLNAGASGPIPPMVTEVHTVLFWAVLAGSAAAVAGSVALTGILNRRISPAGTLREGT